MTPGIRSLCPVLRLEAEAIRKSQQRGISAVTQTHTLTLGIKGAAWGGVNVSVHNPVAAGEWSLNFILSERHLNTNAWHQALY